MVFEILEAAGDERDPMDGEIAHASEFDHIESADGGECLVLAADRLLEDLTLELDCLVGQVEAGDQTASVRIERIQQPDHERRGRAQAREGRELRRVVDLDVLGDARPSQAFPERRVLQLIDRRDALHLAIGDPGRIVEHLAVELGHAEERRLVHGGPEHRPAVFLEVLRIVGASAQKADPQWRLSDDHLAPSLEVPRGRGVPVRPGRTGDCGAFRPRRPRVNSVSKCVIAPGVSWPAGPSQVSQEPSAMRAGPVKDFRPPDVLSLRRRQQPPTAGRPAGRGAPRTIRWFAPAPRAAAVSFRSGIRTASAPPTGTSTLPPHTWSYRTGSGPKSVAR